MIEVILREDVPALGKTGELVRVRPGYARNYLLPNGLAFEATAGNKQRIAAEQKARAAKAAHDRDAAVALAATLASVTVKLTGRAGDEGRLFGSITAQDIADQLARQGHQVDKRKLVLDHPIKALGFHSVALRLHPDVHAEIRVQVDAE